MGLPWWWDDVKSTMAARGVPVRAWLPIVLSESKGYDGATNINPRTGDDSRGLFQENLAGGMGVGHTPAELYTPITAAEIAANHLSPAYRAAGLNWLALSRAGWPGATVQANDPRVTIKEQISNAIGSTDNDQEAWDRTTRWHDPRYNERPTGLVGGGTVDPTQTDPTDPTGGGISIPGLPGIASGITNGIFQGIADAATEHAASWVFAGVGGLLIVAAIFGLAFAGAKTPAGKAVVGAAAPEAIPFLIAASNSTPDRVYGKSEAGLI